MMASYRDFLPVVSDGGGCFLPDLYCDFAKSQVLDSRFAFTRTTTATYLDYDGLLKTAASGTPRFDYDGDGNPLGLFVEPQRSNLFIRSNDYSAATWTTPGSDVTSASGTAPDGTNTAWKLFEENTTGTHNIYQSVSVTPNTYASVFFVKAAERTKISFNNGTAGLTARFNLITGLFEVGTGHARYFGNGWWRVGLTRLNSDTVNRIFGIGLVDANNATSYTGDGSSGVLIWGAQLEVGNFPTSYIATEATQITRNADEVIMSGTNFSDLWNPTEGTIQAEIIPTELSTSAGIVISDNTADNFIRLATASTSEQFAVTDTTTPQTSLDAGTPAVNTLARLAAVYKANDFALCMDGGTVVTDNSGTIPTVSQMQLGANLTTIGAVRIPRIAYFRRRLPNADLVTFTTP